MHSKSFIAPFLVSMTLVVGIWQANAMYLAYPIFLNQTDVKCRLEIQDPEQYQNDLQEFGAEPAADYLLKKIHQALRSMEVKNPYSVPVHTLRKDYNETSASEITLGLARSTGIWLSDVYRENQDLPSQHYYSAQNRYTAYHEAAHFKKNHSRTRAEKMKVLYAQLTQEKQKKEQQHDASLAAIEKETDQTRAEILSEYNKLSQDLSACKKPWYYWNNPCSNRIKQLQEAKWDKLHQLERLRFEKRFEIEGQWLLDLKKINELFDTQSQAIRFQHEQEADELAVEKMCHDGHGNDIELLIKEYYSKITDETKADDYYVSRQGIVLQNALKKCLELQAKNTKAMSKNHETLNDLLFAQAK